MKVITAGRFLAVLVCFGSLLMAQSQEPQKKPASPPADNEAAELSAAVGESGGSPIDFTRALERHLAKYPKSVERPQIEKALAKAAVESADRARIILYGERVLDSDPTNDDMPLIDRVTRALLDTEDPEPARKALEYAKRYEGEVEAMRSRAGDNHMSAALWAQEVNKGKARALALKARATGNTGDKEGALQIAKSAWNTLPNSEAAREVARWLMRLDREAEAIGYLANAFTIEDGRSTEADRARDRARLSELYTKLHGSETGLGDTILRAYDEMASLKKERLAALRKADPNAGATELLEFALPEVNGAESLSLASLKGKAVVMDFWATWCGPCRLQHPMIENVKKRFEKSGDVVFLSIDSDDDHSLVAPFIADMKWQQRVYYEAGLSNLLKIASIPTILVLDTSGKVSSRMTGFIPERFEDMLAERITEARRSSETPIPEPVKN